MEHNNTKPTGEIYFLNYGKEYTLEEFWKKFWEIENAKITVEIKPVTETPKQKTDITKPQQANGRNK